MTKAPTTGVDLMLFQMEIERVVILVMWEPLLHFGPLGVVNRPMLKMSKLGGVRLQFSAIGIIGKMVIPYAS
tara:strand:- start:67 stop:282 length:216 start_codon:yes stop_codon:yes gene_type:complete